MQQFFKQNLDKFLMVIIFFIVFAFSIQYPENKTLENITWLAFGGVLTILGVRGGGNAPAPNLQADIKNAEIKVDNKDE
jgi:hypothetical protein